MFSNYNNDNNEVKIALACVLLNTEFFKVRKDYASAHRERGNLLTILLVWCCLFLVVFSFLKCDNF